LHSTLIGFSQAAKLVSNSAAAIAIAIAIGIGLALAKGDPAIAGLFRKLHTIK
jgi:hypothetical protein